MSADQWHDLIHLLRHARQQDDMEKVIELSPYGRFLGTRAERTATGWVYVLPFAERLVGNRYIPALHGGVVAAFMEMVAVLDLLWQRGDMVPPRTVNVSVSYLSPATARDSYARTSITKLGKRVANVRVDCWQAEPNKPIAQLHGHFLMVKRGKDGAVS